MPRPLDLDPSGDDRPTPSRRSESDGRGTVRLAATPIRDWWGSKFRTAAWLVPLTVLIWIYAEREQELEVQAPKVAVTVLSAVPNRYVEFAGANQKPTVDLKLYGPHDAVEDVRRQLYVQGGLPLEVGSRLGAGAGQSVNVAYSIQNLPLLRQAGVTVRESVPPELTVNVDNVVERDAIVEAPQVSTLVGSVFVPPRVRLRGPAAQIRALEEAEKPADGVLRVTADFAKIGDLKVAGERRQSVPLTLPVAAAQVQVVPPQVAATLQLRAADVGYTIPLVNILVKAPPDVWNEYTVAVENNDTTIPNVPVSGPPDAIAALQALDGRHMTADLEIRAEDAGQERPKRLSFNLPDGVHPTPEWADRRYSFKLTRRDATGG